MIRGCSSCRSQASRSAETPCSIRSFDPGLPLALVPEPENEFDPNAVGVWNAERTLQAGYIPRAQAPALDGSEQAVALWRVGTGLRVLIVPAGSWVGRPRRR